MTDLVIESDLLALVDQGLLLDHQNGIEVVETLVDELLLLLHQSVELEVLLLDYLLQLFVEVGVALQETAGQP